MKMRVITFSFVLALLAGSALATDVGGPPDAIYNRISSLERIEPDRRSAREVIELGRLYFVTGRFDKARHEADAALVVSPDSADALLLRGDTQLQDGDASGALTTFERLAQIRPGSSQVQRRRGLALSAMGLSKEADAAFGLSEVLGDQEQSQRR